MISSVIIAETAEGYAAAINQAGTLRMQSYRIACSLLACAKAARYGDFTVRSRFLSKDKLGQLGT
jgi:nitrate/nitrite-specific signal transduction histidine kinase